MLDTLKNWTRRVVSDGRAGPGDAAPHVVIVGAGFAGLRAARTLAGQDVHVTLMDRHNYHKFQPLLYQVATSGLEPDAIAHSVRDVFRPVQNVDFKLAAASAVDPVRQRLSTHSGMELSYDYLVLAAGAVTSYFGVEGAAEHSFPLKELSDAIKLRNHVLRQFERVDQYVRNDLEHDGAVATGGPEATNAPELRLGRSLTRGALRFVIVGGGPTGVETAGALTELFGVMKRDYKRFDTTAAEVLLVEMGDQLLPAYHPSQGAYTRRVLEERGVRVMTGATVERVEEHAVVLEGGHRIATGTLIWGAGVAASPVAGLLKDAEQEAGGRLKVARDLRVPGRERIFAVGDVSAGEDDEGRLYAQLAQVAIQQGEHAAKQTLRLAKGQPTEPFTYRNLGKMATIGRNAAVAELPGGLRLEGVVAWLAWAFIHVAKLVGVRNRLNVFTDWIYNYLTYNRSARLILDVVPNADETSQEQDAEAQ